MSMVMLVPIMLMNSMKATSSPMNILISLLIVTWFLSMMFMMSGADIWILIYLIMLFNGGLMISYLFIISMMPKEKKYHPNQLNLKLITVIFVISPLGVKMENLLYELTSLSPWVLMTITFFISLFSFLIFILMMDPFKTMKSTF